MKLLLAMRMVMIVMKRMMMLEMIKTWIPIGFLVKKSFLMMTIYCLMIKMTETIYI